MKEIITMCIAIVLISPLFLFSQDITKGEKKQIKEYIAEYRKTEKEETALKIKAMGEEAMKYMRSRINDEDLSLADRVWTMYVLARLKDGKSTKVFINFITDNKIRKDLREWMASILFDFAKPNIESYKNIREAESKEKEEDFRRELITLMGKTGQDEAIPYLTKIIKSTESENIRSSAISALACVKSEKAVDILIDHFNKEKGRLIITYARVLGLARKTKKAVKPFIEKLKTIKHNSDPASYNDTMRMVIIEGLGEIGDKSAIPELRKVIDMGDYIDISVAGVALCKLGDIKGAQKAIEYMEKKNDVIEVRRIKAECGLTKSKPIKYW